MGAESTFLGTQVKHLAVLLRKEANSQQYPSVYENRRPKSIEDTEKTDNKGIASGQKGPWEQRREQGNCSPRPALAGPATGLLKESQLNGSLPCQTGLSNTKRDLVA